MGRDKSGIKQAMNKRAICCHPSLLTTFPRQPISFMQDSDSLLHMVMPLALRSGVSAHPWEQPVPSEHLDTEMMNSVISCGEYCRPYPRPNPNSGSCGSGWGAAVFPSCPYYPVKRERGWVMQPLWKASSRFISFRLPAFWRFPP